MTLPREPGAPPRRYKVRYKLKHVAEALRKGAGIPSAAAVILAKSYGHCSSKTVRNYLQRYPQLQKEVDDQVETNLDAAEAKLLNAIEKNEDWAIKFYLETKGRNRGYSRRNEIAGVPGQPIVVTDARQWITNQLNEMDERLRIEPSRPEPSGADGPVISNGEGQADTETVH
jgi:hypothetical protein